MTDTECRRCNGSEPAIQNLHRWASLAREVKTLFFGQTTSLNGNAVNSRLYLIDVLLEIWFKSFGKSIMET